jgi:hypothetical protein
VSAGDRRRRTLRVRRFSRSQLGQVLLAGQSIAVAADEEQERRPGFGAQVDELSQHVLSGVEQALFEAVEVEVFDHAAESAKRPIPEP